MCGILGIVIAENVEPSSSFSTMAVDCLTAIQHRGTESSGLVGSTGNHNRHFEIVKGFGLVRDVYTQENLTHFNDSIALMGHNRYSTAGMKKAINCIQPFVLYTTVGLIAISHNGELVNQKSRRRKVLKEGIGLSTDTDSEVIGQLIAKTIAQNMKCRIEEGTRALGDISRELSATMSAIDLSYSLLVMTHDRIYAIRDPFGNRPLCIGKMYHSASPKNGGIYEPYAFVAASESCAFPLNTKFHCEVNPGEIIEMSRHGIRSLWQMVPAPKAFCIFEYVYFARPDSYFEGQAIQKVREESGKILASESHVDADIVSTVPDSAISASIGYAKQSGIPYEQVLHRNSYVGRSFIQPNNDLRLSSIVKKFGVLRENVCGKRIILIDDSIVRGNTMGIIVKLLKDFGAKEVHLRIASPPLLLRSCRFQWLTIRQLHCNSPIQMKHPCHMGINIPSKDELIAANYTLNEISEKLGADSVKYLSIDGLLKAVNYTKETLKENEQSGHCTACLTGEYPVPIVEI